MIRVMENDGEEKISFSSFFKAFHFAEAPLELLFFAVVDASVVVEKQTWESAEFDWIKLILHLKAKK